MTEPDRTDSHPDASPAVGLREEPAADNGAARNGPAAAGGPGVSVAPDGQAATATAPDVTTVTDEEAAQEDVAAAPRGGREALYFALRNRKLVAGLTIVMVFVVLAIVGPMLTGPDPTEFVGPPAAPPSSEYWFGTTSFGQDIFGQFTHGLRATFRVGIVGGALAAVLGMLVGFTGGYRGGIIDEILNMLTNIVLVIPTLAVLLIIAAYLEVRSVEVQALIIGLFSWPWVARAVRAQTFSLRSRDFVDLAKLSGVGPWRIILREIAPNMASYLFMTFILLFGGSVLTAASLDFIGLGPTDGISLGLMMNYALQWGSLQLGLWWWFAPPGLGIMGIVGSLYVMNVGLDEVFNPKLREM